MNNKIVAMSIEEQKYLKKAAAIATFRRVLAEYMKDREAKGFNLNLNKTNIIIDGITGSLTYRYLFGEICFKRPYNAGCSVEQQYLELMTTVPWNDKVFDSEGFSILSRHPKYDSDRERSIDEVSTEYFKLAVELGKSDDELLNQFRVLNKQYGTNDTSTLLCLAILSAQDKGKMFEECMTGITDNNYHQSSHFTKMILNSVKVILKSKDVSAQNQIYISTLIFNSLRGDFDENNSKPLFKAIKNLMEWSLAPSNLPEKDWPSLVTGILNGVDPKEIRIVGIALLVLITKQQSESSGKEFAGVGKINDFLQESNPVLEAVNRALKSIDVAKITPDELLNGMYVIFFNRIGL